MLIIIALSLLGCIPLIIHLTKTNPKQSASHPVSAAARTHSRSSSATHSPTASPTNAPTSKEHAHLLNTRLISLGVIGSLASLIIYGLVALIVKIDDFGLVLVNKGHQKVGMSLVNSMPVLMKSLGVIGTVAMILVAGGIFNHFLHWTFMPEIILNFILGVVGGLIVFGIARLFRS